MAFSTLARTSLAICPITGRSSAERVPICLRTAVSSPFFAQVFDPQRLQLGGLPSSGDGFQRMLANGFQLFLHIKSSLLGCGSTSCTEAKQKALRPPILGRKALLPRYHPNSRNLPCTCSPGNGGPPAVSPRRLPGEPNQASTVWLAAGDQTSLGGVSWLFSRS